MESSQDTPPPASSGPHATAAGSNERLRGKRKTKTEKFTAFFSSSSSSSSSVFNDLLSLRSDQHQANSPRPPPAPNYTDAPNDVKKGPPSATHGGRQMNLPVKSSAQFEDNSTGATTEGLGCSLVSGWSTKPAGAKTLFPVSQATKKQWTVDAADPLEVYPHPLFHIHAVLRAESLVVIEANRLSVIQWLIHPLGSEEGLDLNNHYCAPISTGSGIRISPACRLPLQLQHVPMVGRWLTRSHQDDPLYSDIGRSYDADGSPDCLLCAAWHRESLTLVVGSMKSLLIFQICNDTDLRALAIKEDQSCRVGHDYEMKYKLSHYSLLEHPCSSVAWIGDNLLTKGTTPSSTTHAINEDNLPATFYYWTCTFARHKRTSGSQQCPLPFMFETAQQQLWHSTTELLNSISGSYPVLRDAWSFSNVALAEFVSCCPSPVLTWRAVAGANATPSGLGENFLKTFGDDVASRAWVDVCRLRMHPGSRFLAVLYLVSTGPTADDITKGRTGPSVSIPSPVVRVWSLRGAHGEWVNGIEHKRLCGPQSGRFRVASKEYPKDQRQEYMIHGPHIKRRFHPVAHVRQSLTKSASCFLSGVWGLFHLRRRGKHGYRSRADVPLRDLSPTSLAYAEAELQGPELVILRQLSTVTDTPGCWRGHTTPSHLPSLTSPRSMPSTVSQKMSILALMAAHGLVEDNDVLAYQSAAAGLGMRGLGARHTEKGIKRVATLIETAVAGCGDLKQHGAFVDPVGEKTSSEKPSTWDQPFLPVVMDGPYISTSLNHRAPVVDAFWRDDGPIGDEVFIPAVLCVVTLDNCVTIWLESSPETYLHFEAVIVIRLDVSPVKNFFHPLDTFDSCCDCGQSGTTEGPISKAREGRSHHLSENLASLFGPDLLESEGSPFYADFGVTLCWLTAHRVHSDASNIYNILRVLKEEVKNRCVDLDLFKGNRTIEDVPRITDEAESEQPCYLCLRPNGHLYETSAHATLNSFGDSATPPALFHLASEISSSPPSRLPTVAVSDGRHSVDFLVVAERHKLGAAEEALTPASPGLWVYTLRDLAAQPRGSPAVKLLLGPQHLPLPCRVRKLVVVECLRSLGLSSGTWGDGTSGLLGELVEVRDNIVLPPCAITCITALGELWTCVVKPHIEQPTATGNLFADHVPSEDVLSVRYEIRYRSSTEFRPRTFCLFPDPSRCLEESSTNSRHHCRDDHTGHAEPLVSDPPSSGWRASSGISFKTAAWVVRSAVRVRGASHEEAAPHKPPPPTRQLCCGSHNSVPDIRFCAPFWKLIEEHCEIAGLCLALDNRGWLSLADWRYVPCTHATSTESNNGRDTPPPQSHLNGSLSTSKLDDNNFLNSHGSDTETIAQLQRFLAPTDVDDLQQFLLPHKNIHRPSEMLCLHSLSLNSFTHHAGRYGGETGGVMDARYHRTGERSYNQPDCLPFFRHATWAPFANFPPIIIGVTQPQGHLLAFEVATPTAGASPHIRMLPFIGTYCQSLVGVQYLSQPALQLKYKIGEDFTQCTAVSHLEVASFNDNECILLLRICLEVKLKTHAKNSDRQKNATENVTDPSTIREEHLLVFRCGISYKDTSSTCRTPLRARCLERKALVLNLLYEGFLDFSPIYLGVSPELHSDGSSTFREVTAQSVIYVSRGALALTLVTYPIMEKTESKVEPDIQTNYDQSKFFSTTTKGQSKDAVGYLGIYGISCSGDGVFLKAYAAVPMCRNGLHDEAAISNDFVASLAVDEEWLAVLTSYGNLLLYSLTEISAPPRPLTENLHNALSYALLPQCSISLQSSLGTAFVGAQHKWRAMDNQIASYLVRHASSSGHVPMHYGRGRLEDVSGKFQKRNVSGLFSSRPTTRQLAKDSGTKHLSVDAAGDGAEDDSFTPYFHGPRSIFNNRLTLTDKPSRSIGDLWQKTSDPPTAVTDKSLSTQTRQCYAGPSTSSGLSTRSLRRISAYALGSFNLLTFSSCPQNGLQLLVTLPLKDEGDSSTSLHSTLIQRPHHTLALLFVPQRHGDTWVWAETFNQYLSQACTIQQSHLITAVVWGKRTDAVYITPVMTRALFLSSSVMPSLRCPMTRSGDVLVDYTGKETPLYHPGYLSLLLHFTNNLQLLLQILKRLLESLTTFRTNGTVFFPYLDIPLTTILEHQYTDATLEIAEVPSFGQGSLSEYFAARLRTFQSSIACHGISDLHNSKAIQNVLAVNSRQGHGSEPEHPVVSNRAEDLFAGSATATYDPYDFHFGTSSSEEDEDEEVEGQHQTTSASHSPVLNDQDERRPEIHGQDGQLCFLENAVHEAECPSLSPLLPLATPDDLKILETLLSPLDPFNMDMFLQGHKSHVPHLSLIEALELLSFIRLLRFILSQNADSDANTVPFSRMALCVSGSHGSMKTQLDSPGCHFIASLATLLAVQNAKGYLEQAISHLEERVSGASFSGTGVHSETTAVAMRWKTLLREWTVESCEVLGQSSFAGPHFSSTITQNNARNAHDLRSHYRCLKSSDICWAIQCSDSDVLFDAVLCTMKTLQMISNLHATDLQLSTQPIRLSWELLNRVGVGFWIQHGTLATKIASEALARDIYAATPAEDRNPDTVALWYIATGQLSLLQGLYQSVKNLKVAEFLGNDFSDPRWQAAAHKNAFALLKQRRFTLAVSFFLLARAYEDAANVCCKRLGDPQLALFLGVLVDHQLQWALTGRSEAQTHLHITALRTNVIRHKILPASQSIGDRWLQSAAHWLLKEYEESVIATVPSVFSSFFRQAYTDSAIPLHSSTSNVTSPPPSEREETGTPPLTQQHSQAYSREARDAVDQRLTLYTMRRDVGVWRYRRHLMTTIQIRRLFTNDKLLSYIERCYSISEIADHILVSKVPRPHGAGAALIALLEEFLVVADLEDATLFGYAYQYLPFALQCALAGLNAYQELNATPPRGLPLDVILKAFQATEHGSTFCPLRTGCCLTLIRQLSSALSARFLHDANPSSLTSVQDDLHFADDLFQNLLEASNSLLFFPKRVLVVRQPVSKAFYALLHRANFTNAFLHRLIAQTTLGRCLSSINSSCIGPAFLTSSRCGGNHPIPNLITRVLVASCLHGIPLMVPRAAPLLNDTHICSGSTCWSLLSLTSVLIKIFGTIDRHGSFHMKIDRLNPFRTHSSSHTATAWGYAVALWTLLCSPDPLPSTNSNRTPSDVCLSVTRFMATSVLSLLSSALALAWEDQHYTHSCTDRRRTEAVADGLWSALACHLEELDFFDKTVLGFLSCLDSPDSGTAPLPSMELMQKAAESTAQQVTALLEWIPNVPQETEDERLQMPLDGKRDIKGFCVVSAPVTQLKPKAPLYADSDELQTFMLTKVDAARSLALACVIPTSSEDTSSRNMEYSLSQGFWELMFGTLRLAFYDRLVLSAHAVTRLCCVLLHREAQHIFPQESQEGLERHADNGAAQTLRSICEIVGNYQALIAGLRELLHTEITPNHYAELLAKVTCFYPFLPMALSTPLAFSHHPATPPDEQVELDDIDSVCCRLTKEAAEMTESQEMSFRLLWHRLQCSRRLQLLLARGPLTGMPRNLSISTVTPAQLPLSYRIVASLKEPPLSIAVDRTGGVPQAPKHSLLGPSFFSVQPCGLGVELASIGSTRCHSPGLGILSIATGKGTWETNIIHSVLFHRLFSAGAATRNMNLTSALANVIGVGASSQLSAGGPPTVDANASIQLGSASAALQQPPQQQAQLANTEKKNAALHSALVPAGPHSGAQHTTLLGHHPFHHIFHPGAAHGPQVAQHFDDDGDASHSILRDGRLRVYDLAAEVYERQVSRQAHYVFGSLHAFVALNDHKGVCASPGSGKESSDTPKALMSLPASECPTPQHGSAIIHPTTPPAPKSHRSFSRLRSSSRPRSSSRHLPFFHHHHHHHHHGHYTHHGHHGNPNGSEETPHTNSSQLVQKADSATSNNLGSSGQPSPHRTAVVPSPPFHTSNRVRPHWHADASTSSSKHHSANPLQAFLAGGFKGANPESSFSVDRSEFPLYHFNLLLELLLRGLLTSLADIPINRSYPLQHSHATITQSNSHTSYASGGCGTTSCEVFDHKMSCGLDPTTLNRLSLLNEESGLLTSALALIPLAQTLPLGSSKPGIFTPGHQYYESEADVCGDTNTNSHFSMDMLMKVSFQISSSFSLATVSWVRQLGAYHRVISQAALSELQRSCFPVSPALSKPFTATSLGPSTGAMHASPGGPGSIHSKEFAAESRRKPAVGLPSSSHHMTAENPVDPPPLAMSALKSHPWLPVCAGAIADSQISHGHHGTPVVSLWHIGTSGSRSQSLIGYLALHPPPVSGTQTAAASGLPYSSSPSGTAQDAARRGSSKIAVGGVNDSGVSQSHLDKTSRAPHAYTPSRHHDALGITPLSLRHPESPQQQLSARPTSSSRSGGIPALTYHEAGPVKNLEWSLDGTKLVTAHNRGWVAIWKFRSNRLNEYSPAPSFQAKLSVDSAQTTNSTVSPNTRPYYTAHSATAAMHSSPADNAHTLRLAYSNQLGLPTAVFRPHTTSCRFAAFLSAGFAADSSLFITSGRGLAPRPLVSFLLPSWSSGNRHSSPAVTSVLSTNLHGTSSPTGAHHNANASLSTDGPRGSGIPRVVSAAPDEGAVCLWDLNGGDRLGPPQLLMADAHFDKGNYATDFVSWPSRQCIFYSGRRGEVRMMNLLRPDLPPFWVVHPPSAHAMRLQQKQKYQKPLGVTGGAAPGNGSTENWGGGVKSIQPNPSDFRPPLGGFQGDHYSATNNSGYDTSSVTAGPFGKEIVKLFLLEDTRRMVTCYEDGMVRVWDVSEFCSQEFSMTGWSARLRQQYRHQARNAATNRNSHHPPRASVYRSTNIGVNDYEAGGKTSSERLGFPNKRLPPNTTSLNTTNNPDSASLATPEFLVFTSPASDPHYGSVPLLWESPNPLHGPDTSRLSLVASVLGAVFNIAPGGSSPRTLLDATMAGPHHLVTLGADGTIVLSRL